MGLFFWRFSLVAASDKLTCIVRHDTTRRDATMDVAVTWQQPTAAKFVGSPTAVSVRIPRRTSAKKMNSGFDTEDMFRNCIKGTEG